MKIIMEINDDTLKDVDVDVEEAEKQEELDELVDIIISLDPDNLP